MTIEEAKAFLADNGHVVRTADEDKALQERIKKAALETDLPAKVREIYDRLDADIEATSGEKKADGEKTYDYAKRVLGKSKGELETLGKQIADLKEAAKGTEKYQEIIRQKEAEFEQKANAWKEEKAKIESEKAMTERLNLFTEQSAEVYGRIKKKPAFFDDFDAEYRKKLIEQSMIIEENGKKMLVLKDENGNPKRSTTDWSYETPLSLVQQKYADLLKSEGTPGGGGTNPKGYTPSNGTVTLSRQPKSKADARELILEKGDIKHNSPEYHQAFREVVNANPNLPLE